MTQARLDKIKDLTPEPVKTIINTHTHGDHVSGPVHASRLKQNVASIANEGKT